MNLSKVSTEQLVEELQRRLLTADQAASYLNTHVSYLWRLVSLGRVPTVKFFNRALFERSGLDAEEERRQARRDRIAQKKVDDDSSTPPSYDNWTVRDLQRECKSRGLRVRGKKDILIQRLSDHDKS